ncbi:MAG: crossover junction endodeoxyribonuclease RuvC [Acidimicrobiia bacterium]|nr:crossover junction endodeoxyribonuclease RuvC [Acidimicrobiia bacterium]
MFVLGIDPGLTRTGYGILETRGSRSRAVVAGVIRTDPAAGIAQRLAELYHDLREIVAEHDIAEAAIEEVFVNRNLHTAMAVGRASGVALLAMGEAGVPVTEYSPSAVKMALCGYGSADKEQVQKVVAMRLELPQAPKPADAADALAIALCHVQALPMRRAVERAG